ncbi:uncharacterized protein A4U43_C06F15830, partial [Asparagus officinalis]
SSDDGFNNRRPAGARLERFWWRKSRPLQRHQLGSCFAKEILDSFHDQEFWYVDQGILAPETNGSASFRMQFQRHEEKWLLPVPHVPARGLQETLRKQLHHKRECTNQILKHTMAINSNA